MKSKLYRDWLKVAGYALMGAKAVKGPVRIRIGLTPPNRQRFDLDNKIKAILDLLTSVGVIEDDHCGIVIGLDIALADKEPGTAEVEVCPTSISPASSK